MSARDVVVLGAGPGGYAAAFRAADLGQSVTLVDERPTLGGVCLNVGCIPSKALLHAADVIEQADAAREFGIEYGTPKLDLDKLRAWKDSIVGKLTGGLAKLAKQRKVEVVSGRGRFTSANTLDVQTDGGTQTVEFTSAVLATGSRPVRLPFLPDDPRVVDSTGALELADVPARLLVIGGGVIGLEMATVYDALGSEVSVVELTDSLLPGVDGDLVRVLQRRIASRYAAVWTSTKVTEVTATGDGLDVRFEGDKAPERATFDRVLAAVGRTPNSDDLGLDKLGVETDDHGFVTVDDQQRTNVAHVFAIGDLAGEPQLAHKATHEGKVAAEVIAGHKSGFDGRVVPGVAYTDPEVAWVGLSETAAKRDGTAYKKASFPWAASGRALGMGRSDGTTKLLFDPETKRLLGAGIVGPRAGDLVAECALAIEMGADAEDIGLTIHPHPTLGESVAMSAEAFEGTITDLYVPKR